MFDVKKIMIMKILFYVFPLLLYQLYCKNNNNNNNSCNNNNSGSSSSSSK